MPTGRSARYAAAGNTAAMRVPARRSGRLTGDRLTPVTLPRASGSNAGAGPPKHNGRLSDRQSVSAVRWRTSDQAVLQRGPC